MATDEEQIAMLDALEAERVAEEQEAAERKKQLRKAGTLKLQGKDYLQVAHRVAIFRTEHPDWCIRTGFTTVEFEGQPVLLAQASVRNDRGHIIATGSKMVVRGKGAAGKFPVETAETGAIGRALAACGYGTLSGDLDEGEQIADAPQGQW